MVPKEGLEPTHPQGYYVLNVARLPFRHFGIFDCRRAGRRRWWAIEDLNLGPLACEASALTTELIARLSRRPAAVIRISARSDAGEWQRQGSNL